MEIKLSKTSKIPCRSWSTQALVTCHRGAKLAQLPNSICSTCYAVKGHYRKPVVKNRRHENLAQYLNAPREWREAMIQEIGKAKAFRWFDSGDLFSCNMLIHIIEIARALPSCQFWLPTRETEIIKTVLTNFECPDNLNIRISADFIGPDSLVDTALKFANLPVTFSGVIDTSKSDGTPLPPSVVKCPATFDHDKTGGRCLKCRACFNREVKAVVYKLH